MARSRASESSGFELVLVAIGAVVLAVVFMVPYVLALLLYLFPPFVLWLLIPAEVGAEPQLVIDPSPRPQVAKLRAEKRYADAQRSNVRNSSDVRWSDNLGRFEERSIRGQDLNRQLEHWRDESHRLRAEISRLEEPEMAAFEQWSNELRAWQRRHARNAAKSAAWKQVSLSFVAVWIAFEFVGVAYPAFTRLFTFAWNPAPDFLHPGIAIGAAAAWAIGIYRIYHPPKDFDERADDQIREYWNAKGIREEAEDSRTTFSSSDEPFEEEADDEEEPEKPDAAWHEVLNVDPQSAIEDIKAAYKKAAMACHPDKVAHMNAHIQQVAKEDMQKLNNAFQRAQTARGF